MPLTIVGLVVIAAIIKPWGAGVPASGDRGRAPATGAALGTTEPFRSPSRTPSPGEVVDRELETTCGSPSGWRAATLQGWAGRSTPIRSWIAIEPVAAHGPLDPVIPAVPVATGVVLALGYCAPVDERRPPATAVAHLWALGADHTASLLAPVQVEPSVPSELGVLWAPRPVTGSSTAVPAGWAPGRYVIEIVAPDAGFDTWLGMDIEDVRADPSTGPGSTPGPSGRATGSASPGSPVGDPGH